MRKLFAVLLVLGIGVGILVVAGPGAFEDLLERRVAGSDGAPSEESAEPGPDVPSTPSKRFIAGVSPESVYGGTVYRVKPTRAGRALVGDEIETAWGQAVDLGVPNTRSMYNQFKCHPLSVIARAKSTWDLESWRPNVGLTRTMLAGCNPAG